MKNIKLQLHKTKENKLVQNHNQSHKSFDTQK